MRTAPVHVAGQRTKEVLVLREHTFTMLPRRRPLELTCELTSCLPSLAVADRYFTSQAYDAQRAVPTLLDGQGPICYHRRSVSRIYTYLLS
jgi:hypothetical protein